MRVIFLDMCFIPYSRADVVGQVSDTKMCLFFILILSTLEICQSLAPRNVYTNHWAVRIAGGQEEADKLAVKYGYNNYGQIGSLEDHYHFHHSRVVRRAAFSTRGAHSFIQMDPKVDWVQQQLVKQRVKRYIQRDTRSPDPNFVHFNDPKWSNMWYIHCTDKNNRCRSEMNILAAWQRGYTGKNVVVTILDDGIERNHPDLAQNYDQLASYDVNGNDHDPTPRYDSSNENKHGTRCAGEVAAVANNSHCIVGIAYNARIGGIRMLDGDVTDVVEAKSLGIRPDYIDIYSASWGPDDDGKTVDGPGPLAKQAFEMGIKKGRKGLGSIFVWASGNGGRQGDHCSCDGYTNSIYTISISSTTENGNKPWYLEVCSSTLATTYSSGEFYDRKIVTTDLRQRCTDGHTGTSVSAPMVAGVIALALEANPLVSWRDIQHLLVKTSRPVHLKANDWETNAAGHRVSHLYGFGLVDAEGMVVEAKKWRSVPTQHTCTRMSERRTRYIRADQSLNSTITSTGCTEQAEQHVSYVEHVVVKVLIVHPRRGDLEISLISPSGTRSQLLAKRLFDNSNEGFRNWEFMTVHCWGERAEGQWILEIIDSPSSLRNPEVLGKLKEWTLVLYGTSGHPYQSHGTQHSRSRMLEIPSPSRDPNEPEPPPEGLKHQEEEEEDYSGPCHSECGDQGCDGPDPDHCLNCIHYSLGSLKTGRTCVSHCPLGFYDNLEARRCRRCHKGCERCVGRTPTECRSCRRGLYFNPLNATCSETCPAGYFADDIQRKCLRCHENCMKCLRDSDRCTACNDGYSLAGMTCVPECANGTFFHLEEMKCSPCHTSCSTCTGQCPCHTSCSTCTGQCPCHTSCSTCTGQCPCHTSCSTCTGQCPCHTSCSTCTGQCPCHTSCSTCTGQCPCHTSCSTCTGQCPCHTSCSTCTGQCPCHTSCSTCTGQCPCHTSCSTCTGPVTPPALPAQVLSHLLLYLHRSVSLSHLLLYLHGSVSQSHILLYLHRSVSLSHLLLYLHRSVSLSHLLLYLHRSVSLSHLLLYLHRSVSLSHLLFYLHRSMSQSHILLYLHRSVSLSHLLLYLHRSVSLSHLLLYLHRSVSLSHLLLYLHRSVSLSHLLFYLHRSVSLSHLLFYLHRSVSLSHLLFYLHRSVSLSHLLFYLHRSVSLSHLLLYLHGSVSQSHILLYLHRSCHTSCSTCTGQCPCHTSCSTCTGQCPCHTSCSTCTGQCPCHTSCSTCTGQCPCHTSCSTCTGQCPCHTSCSTCTGQCPCHTSCSTCTGQCPCHTSCSTCTGQCPSHTSCSTCTGQCRCHTSCSTCTGQCPCHTSCSTCTGQCPCHTSCSTCTGQCPCHTSCSTCTGQCPCHTSCSTCTGQCPCHTSCSTCTGQCPCHTSCSTCTGPGKEECIQCAKDHLQQEWRCVQTCAPGYYSTEDAGYHQGMCHKCEENCLSCDGPGTTCVKCKDSYNLVSRTCIVNATCNNADEVFCEMVKSNRLCEKKLFRQFCCRTCLMTG
ncbi:proprotein convertase subtilisin/kexin type 6 isoform X14 [Salvelinus namaycush]|uniref:Proprotein convertase subtilisin/kexin type 6 isoform X14 n=1 Tax=Salvelinus namaycush TaxID=8040 RepID=A0A8U0PIS3_SALNM|nr:proprotein convertase subtilisin/kexin type 6 isoform X14 [Salvelinus namaycush]